MPQPYTIEIATSIDAPNLPADGHLVGDPNRTATGSYYLRPFGRPLIEAFFGGRHALELEKSGPGAAFAFARGELGCLFGGAFSARLTLLSETKWASDPLSRGSYSHALPGHSDARGRLAAPVDGRLFFAGEALLPAQFLDRPRGLFHRRRGGRSGDRRVAE